MLREPQEEVRKVQVTGRSTYIVSLPKKWVTKMQLKAGDPLVLSRQSDGSLQVKRREIVDEKPREARFRITRDDLPESIVRRVVAAYLFGYSMIEISAEEGALTPLQKDAVKEVARNKLVGTEIIDESSSHTTLQVLLRIPEFDLKSALRRMTLITASMHRDAMKALNKLDLDVAHEVVKADDDVDRFSLYIIRQLKAALESEAVMTEMGLSDPSHCLGYRVLAKSVERVADHAVRIAESVLTMKSPPPRDLAAEITKMSGMALEVFELSIDSLFKEDYMLADEVVLKAREVTSFEPEILKLLASLPGAGGLSLRLILEDIKRTAEYSSDIAEIVLNRTIERSISPS